jgi:hypothetical protein
MTEHHSGILGGGQWFTQLQTQLSWSDFTPYRTTLRQCARLSQDELDDHFKDIVEIVEAIGMKTVVGSFVNYYRNGQDYAPYHRDVYGFDSVTVSFGGSRDFLLKSDTTNVITKTVLSDGDIFTFPLYVNQTHTHSVPKRALAEPRISMLLFLN